MAKEKAVYEKTEVEGEVSDKGKFDESVQLGGKQWLVFKKAEGELRKKYDEIENGDYVKAEAEAQKGKRTHHIKKLIEHKKGDRPPPEQKEPANQEEPAKPPQEAIKEGKVEIVEVSKMLAPVPVVAGVDPFVAPLVDVEKVVNCFNKFKEIKAKVLQPEDFSYIDKAGKWHKKNPDGEASEYIEKTGWQKIALAFSLTIEFVCKEKAVGRDNQGQYYVWSYIYRISHPCGNFVTTEGSCSSRDPFFGKSKGRIVDPNESDIIHTAQTVAVNRGVSMLVGGGVTADEMRRGRDKKDELEE